MFLLQELPPDGIYFEQGDKIRVGTPGLLTSPEDPNFNSWMHNVSIRHNPTVFEQTSTTGVYNVVTAAAHDFFEEDFVEDKAHRHDVVQLRIPMKDQAHSQACFD